MPTKTISLRLEAYERLRRARRHPGESFSDVVMRAQWPDEPLCAGDYLDRARERGAVYDVAGLDAVESLDAADAPADDNLKANGLLIGANDLWIGATALAFRQPLVTRNVAHFRRIPGLTVLAYGAQS